MCMKMATFADPYFIYLVEKAADATWILGRFTDLYRLVLNSMETLNSKLPRATDDKKSLRPKIAYFELAYFSS